MEVVIKFMTSKTTNNAILEEITKNIIDLLIKVTPREKLSFQLSKPDLNGRTLLQLACFHNYEEIVVTLLEHINDPIHINLLNFDNESALDIACKKGYYYFAFLLMEKGANLSIKAIHTIKSFLIYLEEEMENLLNIVFVKESILLPPNIRYGLSQQYVHLRNIHSDISRAFKKAVKV